MKPIQILYVEDNPAEVKLVQQAFEETDLLKELHVLGNGEDAVRYLRNKDEFVHAARPHLILLDLNLPKKNGFEVLASVKSDSSLKNIPIIVFTGSQSQDDVFKAYQGFANAYLRKPHVFSEYVVLLRRLVDFWTQSVIFSEK